MLQCACSLIYGFACLKLLWMCLKTIAVKMIYYFVLGQFVKFGTKLEGKLLLHKAKN
jgi:hypothetical protein